MLRGKIAPAIIVIASAIFIQTGCCNPNATLGSVSVSLRPQETNNWCWAATTQMITEFLGHGRTQCDLANQRFSRNDCCNPASNAGPCPKNNACNTPGWTMFDESGFDSTASSTPLSFAAVKSQIFCNKKPMSYAYGPKSGGVGHVLVVSGYVVVGGIQYLSLNDPWSPCSGANRLITYDEYSSSGTTDHWETSYNITWRN